MKVYHTYGGIIVPVITPLKADLQLDESGLARIFASLAAEAAHPFILGTTGECASFSRAFKQHFIRKATALKPAGGKLYVGISSNCFTESVELAKLAFDKGADAVAATLPAYYPLTPGEMEKYFESLANAVAGPLIIYNIPATVHMSIPLDTIDRLSKHPGIVATKDSERSQERLEQSLLRWKDRHDFVHLLGWAAQSAFALQHGSAGLVPSTANLVPGIYRALLQASIKGDAASAAAMQLLSDRFGNLYQQGKTLGQSLGVLKWLMKRQGICEAVMMPPLQQLTEQDAQPVLEEWNRLNEEMTTAITYINEK